MGFYGNITNTSRTQFQFDKIYSSRRAMEESMVGDGVFIGRYVLVEYDSDVTNVYKQLLYRKDDDYFGENNQFYYLYKDANLQSKVSYTNALEGDTSINYGVNTGYVAGLAPNAYKGAIAYVVEPSGATTFYQCVGSDNGYAIFQFLDSNSSYVFNYSQDKEWAQEKGYTDIGRGWDSTVWQKVYSNGTERYVMIAELNSVVPTFDISADAPSISPLTPHFDENSTNVYYNLHWLPQWGIRVKSAYGNLQGAILTDSGTVDEVTQNIPLNYSENILSYPSDVMVTWDKEEYDKKRDIINSYSFGLLDDETHIGTWVNVNTDTEENINKAKLGIPAAIYFNKDGFNAERISKSSDLFDEHYKLEKFNYVSRVNDWPEGQIKDEICLTPSGLSGHKYNQHTGVFDKVPKVDTYEFSMMLPSLGDTISDIWDLIYGGRNITSIESTNTRNMDIAWEDASLGQQKRGLRLVHLKDGKFSYNTNEINTLAGCINSAHDIMGMIIHSTAGEDLNLWNNQQHLNSLSSDLIYYHGGSSYYRKRKFYDYINEGENLTVELLNARLKNYEKVDLLEFEENKYYDKIAANYLLLNEPTEDFHTVYTIPNAPRMVHEESGTFSNTYEQSKYFYRINAYGIGGTGDYADYYNYTLDTSPIQDETKEYVSLFNYDSYGLYQVAYDDETGELISEPIRHEYFFYRPGVYYYFLSEDTGADPTLNEEPLPDNSLTKQNNNNLEHPGPRAYYYHVVEYEIDIVTNDRIRHDKYIRINDNLMVDFEPKKYYTFRNNTYYLMKEVTSLTNISNGRFTPEECYTLPWVERNSDRVYFYQAGLYYYINNNNYLLDTNLDYTPNRVYYIAPTAEAHTDIAFYKTNTYYATNDENTEPAINATVSNDSFDESKTYWKKTDVYVANDPHNIYAVGMKWDLRVQDATDALIVLCNRTERWGVEELEGFATKINTMLGLILRVRALLDEGHADTRDTKTVQGCINTINDIISRFGSRKIGDIMIANNYGLIAGASKTTSLAYQYTNLGLSANADSLATESAEDQWITLSVNSAYANPSITLKHTLVSEKEHAVGPFTTSSNLNDTTSGNGLNKGQTDNLLLYTPVVDLAGHVVGKNTETVTLPYGFKILKSQNYSGNEEAWSQAAGATASAGESTNDIIADSTLDTLSFASGNKWIRMQSDPSNDKLTFAHETHTVTPTTSTASLSSESTATTFTVPTYSFDTAGHYNGLDIKTITMPCAYGKISGDTGTTTAVATLDTLSIISGDGWLTTLATADTLTISHNASNVTANTYGTNATTSLSFGSNFVVPNITVDSAGHITAASNTTLTLPSWSFSDSGTGNVVTGLLFNNNQLSTTKANISSLQLTGFTSDNAISGNVSADDTLTAALNKIQNKVGTASTDNDTQVTVSLAEVYGQISVANTQMAQGMTTDGTYIYMAAIDTSDGVSNPIIYKYDIENKEVIETKHPVKKGHYNNLNYYTMENALSAYIYATGFNTNDVNDDYSQVLKYDYDNNNYTMLNLPLWYWNFAVGETAYGTLYAVGLLASRHCYDIYTKNNVADHSAFRPFTRSPIEYINGTEQGCCLYTYNVYNSATDTNTPYTYILTITTDPRTFGSPTYGALQILVTNLTGRTVKKIILDLPYYEELEDICAVGNTIYFNSRNGRIYKINDISIYFNYYYENYVPAIYLKPCFLYINTNGTESTYTGNYNGLSGTLLKEFSLSPLTDLSLLKSGARGMFVFRNSHHIPFCINPDTGNITINFTCKDGDYTYEIKLFYTRTSTATCYMYTLSSIVGGYRDSSGTLTKYDTNADSDDWGRICNNIFYTGSSYIHHIVSDSTIPYSYDSFSVW